MEAFRKVIHNSQIHSETNREAQQVSYFFSTVTTPCNPDSTLSYGESGSSAVTCVCVESQTSYLLPAESLSYWCESRTQLPSSSRVSEPCGKPAPLPSSSGVPVLCGEPDSATVFQLSLCAISGEPDPAISLLLGYCASVE